MAETHIQKVQKLARRELKRNYGAFGIALLGAAAGVGAGALTKRFAKGGIVKMKVPNFQRNPFSAKRAAYFARKPNLGPRNEVVKDLVPSTAVGHYGGVKHVTPDAIISKGGKTVWQASRHIRFRPQHAMIAGGIGGYLGPGIAAQTVATRRNAADAERVRHEMGIGGKPITPLRAAFMAGSQRLTWRLFRRNLARSRHLHSLRKEMRAAK